MDGETDPAQARVFFARNRRFPGLATARAIGDFKNGKQIGVSARPDIRLTRIPAPTTGGSGAGAKRPILVLATDGVWDVLDGPAAADICLPYAPGGGAAGASGDAEMAARVLVQTSRVLWEQRPGSDMDIDDISAVVAFL